MLLWFKRKIMKTTTLFAIALIGIFTTFTATAQNNNVGIGTTTPDASAKLDVESTTQGLLPPRMSAVERDLIVPVFAATTIAAGLLIWCTNCGTNGEMQVYNGTVWTNMVGGAAALAIGEMYAGGIVFYLDGSGGGLISATTDQSTSLPWNNVNNSTTSATGTAVGAGQANTTAIISSQGTPGIGTNYAAYLCDTLTLGGYMDWFLPSKDELNLMYQNIGQGSVGLGNVGGFASSYYWSSTEIVNLLAWGQNFFSGSQDYVNKANTFYVRAVRAF